jgi:hypothetical protein
MIRDGSATPERGNGCPAGKGLCDLRDQCCFLPAGVARSYFAWMPVLAIAALLVATYQASAADAWRVVALSEIQQDGSPPLVAPDGSIAPSTEPVQRFPLPEPDGLDPLPPREQHNVEPERPGTEADELLPEVHYDVSKLPAPAQRMHELITAACRSGDIEKLRPLIGMSDSATQLSLAGLEGDPIEFLREISGDDPGQEIMAILLEVLEAGYVHLEAGTPNEIYVWPYFFALPLDRLSAPQRVELFKIVTAGDYEDMKTYGTYNFYRAGITPEGRWVFFVAGD